MGVPINKLLALDTNIIYDLAEGTDFAFTFLEVFQERGYRFCIPPTVLQELAYAYAHKRTLRKISETALSCLVNWGIEPFDLISVGHGITEQFSVILRAKNLLPPAECNDGLILAETALANIPVLVTADSHFLRMDPVELRRAFEDQDLSPVLIFHPKQLLKTMVDKIG